LEVVFGVAQVAVEDVCWLDISVAEILKREVVESAEHLSEHLVADLDGSPFVEPNERGQATIAQGRKNQRPVGVKVGCPETLDDVVLVPG
jgi:hypothetical protein